MFEIQGVPLCQQMTCFHQRSQLACMCTLFEQAGPEEKQEERYYRRGETYSKMRAHKIQSKACLKSGNKISKESNWKSQQYFSQRKRKMTRNQRRQKARENVKKEIATTEAILFQNMNF